MIYLIIMAEMDTQVKKWGDSLAVIIPKEIAEKEKIHLKDKVHLRIEKETDLSDVFGILKGKLKKTPQQLKNEARKGWD